MTAHATIYIYWAYILPGLLLGFLDLTMVAARLLQKLALIASSEPTIIIHPRQLLPPTRDAKGRGVVKMERDEGL